VSTSLVVQSTTPFGSLGDNLFEEAHDWGWFWNLINVRILFGLIDIMVITIKDLNTSVISPTLTLDELKLDNSDHIIHDVPAKLVKQFAAYLAEPLADIYNSGLRRGEYPDIYKFEICTPVPKSYPPQTTAQLRNIATLGPILISQL
jgi:hypothetical protein